MIDQRAPQLYLESLGISEAEKKRLVRLSEEGTHSIDPVVMMLIGATCGNAYKDLIGAHTLMNYPIPSITLTPSEAGNRLLDIGCNWGRWSIAAAKQGFSVVGIDPSLGAVMAARRVAKEHDLDIKYLVADGRFLPFRDNYFKAVYSYSVLQHFSKDDAKRTIVQISRVLEPAGVAKIQMANRWGLRSIQHQAHRKFHEPKGFEVRYWTIGELKSAFSEIIGRTDISPDCYFGLGWQWSDFRYLPWRHKAVLMGSEALKRLGRIVWPMGMLADSVFCTATKAGSR
jgi:2-polyprenyl-3-methyl-5-hydroxy-6-metoxy-1,4-benzoquinol methylase